jgi:hypothetical protein
MLLFPRMLPRALVENKVVLFVLVIFTLFSLLFAVLGWGAFLHHRSIERDGLRAVGTVLSRSIIPDPEEGPSYRVEYSFSEKNGAVVTGQWLVREATWRALSDGAAITIAYSPEDPWRSNFPVGESSFVMAGVLLPLFLSIPAMVLIIAVVCGVCRAVWKDPKQA